MVPLLPRILEDPVVVVEAFGDDTLVDLFPEEAAVVANAVDGRRREFATVRGCARTALARLGVGAVPILPRGPGSAGGARAPRWPEGIVGSMTHCAGYRAAAVARRSTVVAIGIDAEPNSPLPDGVLDVITVAHERSALARLTRNDPGTPWDRLLFSAKESVFKAWFPLAGHWLNPTDCDLAVDPSGAFVGRLVRPDPVVKGESRRVFVGRWVMDERLVATAVVVRAGPGQPP